VTPASVHSLPSRSRAARLPPAERRAQLLSCAIRVFARRGLGRAGHAEIAREAGVSVPTVFAYFKTRDELVRGVLAEIARILHEMADRHYRDEVPAPRALLDFAFAFAASVDERPDTARVLLEWSTAVREDVWPLFLELHAGMHARIRDTIERGRRERSIDHEIDAENAALMMIGSAQLVVQMKFTRVAPEKLQRFLLTMLRGAIGERGFAAAVA
jgi:TetR/AcrR family transcriptional regulator, hemagglutinin/protease regulatory protein